MTEEKWVPFKDLRNIKERGQNTSGRWIPNDFSSKLSGNRPCWKRGRSRNSIVVEKDSVKLSWSFSAKVLANFLKALPNKQISLFFGPPENQQAKYLEYSHETISIFNTLDWSTFVWMDLLLPFDSHCFDCALLLGSHWLSQVLPPVRILWRNASGSWSYLLKISMDCSGVVCGWSG